MQTPRSVRGLGIPSRCRRPTIRTRQATVPATLGQCHHGRTAQFPGGTGDRLLVSSRSRGRTRLELFWPGSMANLMSSRGMRDPKRRRFVVAAARLVAATAVLALFVAWLPSLLQPSHSARLRKTGIALHGFDAVKANVDTLQANRNVGAVKLSQAVPGAELQGSFVQLEPP